MEHNAKIELLRKMGILDGHSPTPKTLPRISSEELPEQLNAQTEKKQGLSHIGKQQSMPLWLLSSMCKSFKCTKKPKLNVPRSQLQLKL